MAVRPFIPQPNLLDLGFPLRVMRQKPFNELLKLLAVIAVAVDGTDKLRKGSHKLG